MRYVNRPDFTKAAVDAMSDDDRAKILLMKDGALDVRGVLKGIDAVVAHLKADGVTDDVELQKATDGMTDGEVAFPFVLSTAAVDRHGDSIKQAGWGLANYRKNPVVLWAHDQGALPVARASACYVAGDKLKAVDRFSDDHEMARTVAALLAKGFLNAVSVGFRPIKWSWNEERGSFAVDFDEVELLEHSVVPVPAHPDALIEARSAGIQIAPLLAWAEALIETDKGIVIPRDRLKSAISATSTRFVFDTATKTAAPLDTEPTFEAAMSRVAKAGFAVVDFAAAAALARKSDAPAPAPEPAPAPAPEPAANPSPASQDPPAAPTNEDPAADAAVVIADELRGFGSGVSDRLRALRLKISGRLD